MNLTEKPEIVIWPETHYIYIEKIGPFQEMAPQAWNAMRANIPDVLNSNKINGMMTLYKLTPKMLYRAGVITSSEPVEVPKNLEYMKFKGGKYSRFVLTGSYINLPIACGRVFDIIKETKIKCRDDFYIEHYVNDPRITSEEQLITEILVPTL